MGSWLTWIVVVLLIALLGGLLYWLLIITEGVYLGRRVVVWLYDLTAHTYDGIKQYEVGDEQILVVEPILGELGGQRKPLLLDIATGTGRVPQFLLSDGRFVNRLDGRIIGLEPAPRMLELARKNVDVFPERAEWIRQLAVPLPFAAESFDGVTCLESLEFFPSTEDALAEMVRVLKPGGFLMITQRIGWEARSFIGRQYTREQYHELLHGLGLAGAMSFLWQNNYDLVIAHKPAILER